MLFCWVVWLICMCFLLWASQWYLLCKISSSYSIFSWGSTGSLSSEAETDKIGQRYPGKTWQLLLFALALIHILLRLYSIFIHNLSLAQSSCTPFLVGALLGPQTTETVTALFFNCLLTCRGPELGAQWCQRSKNQIMILKNRPFIYPVNNFQRLLKVILKGFLK